MQQNDVSSTASGTVSIAVAPVADIVADSVSTPEETALTYDPLANDTFSDPARSITAIDGQAIGAGGAVVQVANGQVSLDASNHLTFTPAANYTGTTHYTYTVTAGGSTETATETVTVTPVNHPPQNVGTLASQSAQDAATVSYGTASAFTDRDGDTLTYSATGLPTGLSIDASTGVISGTIDHSASQANGGSYGIVVTATDPSNTSATQTFALDVTNPPPVAHDDTATTPQEQAATIAVLANDVDPDGDALSVTSASAQHGSVVVNPDNTITYTPNALYRGTDSIAYAISDGQGGTSSAHVAVTVTPVNHAPTAQPIGAQSGADAQAITLDVGGFFADPDGDPLTYTATGLPPGVSIDPSTGRIAGTLDHSASQGSVYHVVVTATDPSNAVATSGFDWTIVNPPPVVADTTGQTPEDTAIVLPALANAHDPDGDAMRVTAASAQHGTVTVNPDGTIAYQPGPSFAGVDQVRYTVTDADGGTATATIAVTVVHVNHPPVVPAPGDPVPATGGRPVRIDGLAGVTDPDGDSPTIVQATSANGTVSVSPDGIITFTPYLGFAGATTIHYVVADGRGGFTDATLVVRVADGRGADIDELLEIGRVKFVDPSPGFVQVNVTDGLIRSPLTIFDAVEQVRSLSSTAIGRQPVGDAVAALRTLNGTPVDSEHPVLGEIARLDRLRDQRDAGDRLFDHRWGDFLVKGLTGFSVANDAHACITVEAIVHGGAIYVEVRDSAGDRASPIRSVDVRPADGSHPDWIHVDPQGFAIIEPAADMDELHLVVGVTRADGHTTATPIVIQRATGEVELDHVRSMKPHHTRAAPLDATLHSRHATARAHAAHIDRIFQ